MQPSSQSSPQRWNLLTPKINGKFDFRSACRKIPKTTAFILILTLILGISYMIPIFFSLAWNLIPQSRIYPCKVEFIFATHLFFGFFSMFLIYGHLSFLSILSLQMGRLPLYSKCCFIVLLCVFFIIEMFLKIGEFLCGSGQGNLRVIIC